MKNASILGVILFLSLGVYALVDQIKMQLNKPDIISTPSTEIISKGNVIPSKNGGNMNQHNTQNLNDNTQSQGSSTNDNATVSDNSGKYDYDIRILKGSVNSMWDKYSLEKQNCIANDPDQLPYVAAKYVTPVLSLLTDIGTYISDHKQFLSKSQMESLIYIQEDQKRNYNLLESDMKTMNGIKYK